MLSQPFSNTTNHLRYYVYSRVSITKLCWETLEASSVAQSVSGGHWTCEVPGSNPGNGGLYLTQYPLGSSTTGDQGLPQSC